MVGYSSQGRQHMQYTGGFLQWVASICRIQGLPSERGAKKQWVLFYLVEGPPHLLNTGCYTGCILPTGAPTLQGSGGSVTKLEYIEFSVDLSFNFNAVSVRLKKLNIIRSKYFPSKKCKHQEFHVSNLCPALGGDHNKNPSPALVVDPLSLLLFLPEQQYRFCVL